MPGIFLIDGSSGAFLHPDFSLVTSTNPGTCGEVLLLFLTGLGAVNPTVATEARSSRRTSGPLCNAARSHHRRSDRRSSVFRAGARFCRTTS